LTSKNSMPPICVGFYLNNLIFGIIKLFLS
jgi:hypothetical protein